MGLRLGGLFICDTVLTEANVLPSPYLFLGIHGDQDHKAQHRRAQKVNQQPGLHSTAGNCTVVHRTHVLHTPRRAPEGALVLTLPHFLFQLQRAVQPDSA